MKKDIIGTYTKEEEAVGAIKALVEKGYQPSDISIVAKDDDMLESVADETHVKEEKVIDDDIDSATYGTIAGFLTGIGGGIAVPGLGVPGVGPLLAAGPFASMFDDGEKDMKEILLKMDVSESDAERYMQDLQDGKIIVMVERK
ncbi:general stress protein [Fictibacillus barbaricus]|uniref:General stress protein n=1 Tax=Fictibacillus barbaricus TaxID=182136 RepID=A0ABS2Z954_9BACL|nr:general stress protein [Fictibacillus barbaricus]MBN3544713.1 general stress protein [Fictibacillus barbaricus]GGB64562.1 sulfate transporter [Fictibacillus barbaricus]